MCDETIEEISLKLNSALFSAEMLLAENPHIHGLTLKSKLRGRTPISINTNRVRNVILPPSVQPELVGNDAGKLHGREPAQQTTPQHMQSGENGPAAAVQPSPHLLHNCKPLVRIRSGRSTFRAKLPTPGAVPSNENCRDAMDETSWRAASVKH